MFYLNRLSSILILLVSYSSWAIEVPIDDFPLNAYSQNINDYLPTKTKDYSRPLLTATYQKQQLRRFYNHYYASGSQGLSPWSEEMVKAALPLVYKIEMEALEAFNNLNKTPLERHYAENFKEQSQTWWNRIKQNMDLATLVGSNFKAENRAIAVANTYARALPDLAPDFYHFSLPGQGFPFDNLQESAIWVGTPLYVLTTSKDGAWSLVLTPDSYFAWVKNTDIAYASKDFISRWQESAKKSLIAITKTETTISDLKQQYQFIAYIGAVFPGYNHNDKDHFILIPVKNESSKAEIKTAIVSLSAGEQMPLTASKKNLARIMQQLQNRPYGWGGSYFFNDCSQEMKSLFTAFGIWLPRNSAAQGSLNTSLDLSQANLDERLATLKEKGRPLMTLIYLGGHVMLYLGNKQINNELQAISYQNVWGLSPKNRDKRYLIGQSVLLPILKYFPENSDINSQGNARYFRLVFLDELESQSETPKTFVKQLSSTANQPSEFRE